MRQLRLLGVGLSLLTATQANAATFTVNTTADLVDIAPGDGVCRATSPVPSNEACSLRAAIQESNALPGPDVILLPAGVYRLTIPGKGEDAAATGDLDIVDDIEIEGSGLPMGNLIDGHGLDRVFDVVAPVKVLISGVNIAKGNPGLGEDGGAIWNMGQLVVKNARIYLNAALPASGNPAYGGAIYNFDGGDVKLMDTSLLVNFSYAGGGLLNLGSAELTRATISSNKSTLGGGIWNVRGGTLRMEDSTLHHNVVTGSGSGGGLHNDGVASLERVTCDENVAHIGAGIVNDAIHADLTLINVTIAKNTATNDSTSGGFGGGLTNTIGVIHATNSTIAGNIVNPPPPGFLSGGHGGGIYHHSISTPAVVELKNVIVADHLTGGDCAGSGAGPSLSSLGHNLASDHSCSFSAISDLNAANPKLGLLQDNGGWTRTRAIGSGSPAIDSGDSAGCPSTDQRGVSRPQGAACDRGAYEVAQSFIRPVNPVIRRPKATDLRVEETISPEPVSVGQRIVLTATMTNQGYLAARRAALAHPIPAGLDHVTWTTTQGQCRLDPTAGVLCELGTLPRNGLARVTITATVAAAGTGILFGVPTVTSATIDNDDTNNGTLLVIPVNEPHVSPEKPRKVPGAPGTQPAAAG